MAYLAETGERAGYEDVFTRIALWRKHCVVVTLGAEYADQFIR
jgi:hypothetical protein